MNVIAVGAHFDDVELGCGGSLAKHIKNGDKVNIYVATTSGFKNTVNSVVRSNSEAYLEGKAAAEIINAELICGQFPTLDLEFNDALNFQLVKIIEEKKIDIMYTHWRYDVHHDHVALAKASLHAGRHLNRILMYRSNWYDSDMQFNKNFYVDITETWDVKCQAIMAHKSEIKRAGLKWLKYFEREALNNGEIIGCEYAEGFQCVKWII